MSTSTLPQAQACKNGIIPHRIHTRYIYYATTAAGRSWHLRGVLSPYVAVGVFRTKHGHIHTYTRTDVLYDTSHQWYEIPGTMNMYQKMTPLSYSYLNSKRYVCSVVPSRKRGRTSGVGTLVQQQYVQAWPTHHPCMRYVRCTHASAAVAASSQQPAAAAGDPSRSKGLARILPATA